MTNMYSSLTPELQKVLNTCTNLPSLPAVALKIIDASKDPDISLEQILSIISVDPAISAKMLKLANSPFYSKDHSINNLHDALMLLGNNATLTVALCFSLPSSLGKNYTHANYWRRSILAASIARILGARLNVAKIEDLFLASLLQDIGILVISAMDKSPYPDEENKTLKHTDYVRYENKILNTEHPLVGAWLLESWGLPELIINSVKYSHSLNLGESAGKALDSNFHYCLSLSGDLADIWLDDNPSEPLQMIMSVAKTVLGLGEDGFNKLIVEIDESLPEISSMFEISLVEEQDRRRVVDSARDLLIERSILSSKEHENANQQIETITKKVEMIEKESQLDGLTKVYNRQYFYDILKFEYDKSKVNGKPFSLSFIDIDDFKLINDTYGHLVGDNVLKMLADYFTKNTRECDVFARYGGDEFLLMLSNSTPENFIKLLERLVVYFNKNVRVEVDRITLSVSISLGTVIYAGESYFLNVNALLQAADEALYEAKEKGKNRISVYSIPKN